MGAEDKKSLFSSCMFKKSRLLAIFIVAVLAGALIFLISGHKKEENPIKNYSALIAKIETGKVAELQILNGRGEVQTKLKGSDKEYTVGVPESASGGAPEELLRSAEENNVEVSAKPYNPNSLPSTLLRMLPTTIFFLLIIGLLGSQMGWWSNRSKISSTETNTLFSDVAGCDEARDELDDVQQFLENPRKFERLGAKVPKGVLLYGPPGTGKTMLAKAIASEAGVPFYSASGSEFIEMFAGLGARRVRSLFQAAKKSAPSIIFIDELDAVGSHRSSMGGDGATREADQTLIQLLKEMDGFEVNDNPVVVIGATNRIESLDRALLRPGRFDRHVSVDPPDRKGREEVLEVHAADKKISPKVDIKTLAAQTSGMTGADLSFLLNEAALRAARRGAETIEPKDIDDAFFRVVAGVEKHSRTLTDTERETIAVHECGHAIVGEKLHASDQVHKISIIPRGQSGGQTLYVSEEDVFLYSEGELRNRICALLAGRAAENVVWGHPSSGASDDLQRATEIAEQMLLRLGMSKSGGLQSVKSRQDLAPGRADALDKEIQNILQDELERAENILQEDRDTLESLKTELLEKETLDREQFLRIIGESGESSNN